MTLRTGLVLARVVFIGMLALYAEQVLAQERYDPTTDPSVASYLTCIQLASGGGDNSNVPDVSQFDNVGYVTWADGTTKAILCQDIDK